jgi:hypothetical protein
VIAPIADARAALGGATELQAQRAPFWLMLLAAGDAFADSPGRIHLLAKTFAAMLAAYPLAYFASVRFPVTLSVLLTGGVAAYIAAPFAGEAELALGLFIALSVAMVCPPADESRDRARFEGVISGVILFALWSLNPIFSLLGFIVLSACPFVSGRGGLDRYLVTMAAVLVFAAITEFFGPGFNIARANAASGLLSGGFGALQPGAASFGLAGVGVSTAIVLAAAAVFGGREYLRAWLTAAVFLVVSVIAARVAGAQPLPLFVLAAAIGCLSVASPFYDGIFRQHDRASIAVSGSVAVLTIFWAATICVHAAGQFALQLSTAQSAQANIRAELGLVQPGGPTIARWIEDGRFSTPEARELFALQPVDQSSILLEAAARARNLAREGVNVAILTETDVACVIADPRLCARDGKTAAADANVVFVPRIDLNERSADVRGSSEALLYTQFTLAERTALWEIWVRRDFKLPNGAITVGRGL